MGGCTCDCSNIGFEFCGCLASLVCLDCIDVGFDGVYVDI